MPMFWPFFPTLPTHRAKVSRQTRLQDLDARMTSFLSEKQVSNSACPKVLDNVKTARSKVQREMATARQVS